MNTKPPYDPEDLEALMLNKSFDELLPDERTFVLQHLSGEREYESMRQLLFQSMESMQESNPQPPGALKERVMNEFREHRQSQSQKFVWLNFLTQLWVAFRSKPVMQFATACAVLLFVVVLWNPFPGGPELAESVIKEQKDKSESQVATEESDESSPEVKIVEEETTQSDNEVEQDSETETHISSPEDSEPPAPPNSPAEEVILMEEDVADREETNYATGNAAPAAASARFENAVADSGSNAKRADIDEKSEAEIERTQVELVDDALLSVLFTAR